MSTRAAVAIGLAFAGAAALDAAPAGAFTYMPPGQLTPGSGQGLATSTVHLPGMRFPIESAPAYLNSQVWGAGGSNGPGGGQCASSNYSYPWRDNYCETRSWAMPLCPSGTGHQGQDMRAATCQNNLHWAVAVESGTITHIGTYSVYLQGASGVRHRYLHLAPSSLQVAVGSYVQRGKRIGRVSNAFGGTPTTIHLHFDMRKNVSGHGLVYVSPYMALVRAYEDLIGPGPPPEEPPPEPTCVPGPVAGAESSTFKDMVPGSLGYAHVDALHNAGITSGCSQSPKLYCPECPTARYMMAVFLVNALGLPTANPPATPSFSDVPKTRWYYPHVEAILAAGITYGCGGGAFCPDAPVTRAQAAAFIVRAVGWPYENPATATFADVPKGSTFYTSVETLKRWCVTNGCTSGNYCPNDNLSRLQAAVFIARAFDLEDLNACVSACDPATCQGNPCEDWSACGGFSGPCDTTGTRTRTCQQLGCVGAAPQATCDATTTQESQACTRTVDCPPPDTWQPPADTWQPPADTSQPPADTSSDTPQDTASSDTSQDTAAPADATAPPADATATPTPDATGPPDGATAPDSVAPPGPADAATAPADDTAPGAADPGDDTTTDEDDVTPIGPVPGAGAGHGCSGGPGAPWSALLALALALASRAARRRRHA